MNKVVISYSFEDKELAELLAKKLGLNQVNPFLDESNFGYDFSLGNVISKLDAGDKIHF